MAEISTPTNPYIAGNPVTGPEMFFGRTDVFEYIRQALTGEHQDNAVVLYGQSRTGKTSILYQMERNLDSRYIPVLIDLQALSMHGVSTFFWEVATSVCRALSREHSIVVERPRREEFDSSPRDFFQETFLGQVWQAIGDRHLLLMFDEAVRLEEQVLAGNLERAVYGYLRHLMQNDRRLNFVFCLGSRVEEMHRDFVVLFNAGLYKRISFLGPDDARQLITRPVKGVFQYEDQAIEQILELCGMHAYYTQLICHSVFSRFAGEWSVITLEDLQSVIPEVIERGAASFSYVWDHANAIEKLVLATMAHLMVDQNRSITPNQIRQALKRRGITLSAAEIGSSMGNLVFDETIVLGDGYKFAVDLLRRYLRDNRRLEWVQEELGAEVEVTRRE